MKTEDIPHKQPAPWIPETDLETLGLVGKLGEEAAELAARCCRAAIQGWEALDPDDGRTNAEHIWDEVADVEAMILSIKERRITAMDASAVLIRSSRKHAFKGPWFDFLNRAARD